MKETLSVLVNDQGRNKNTTITVENLQQANWGYLHSGAKWRGEIEWNGARRYCFGSNLHDLACAEEIGEYEEEAYQER